MNFDLNSILVTVVGVIGSMLIGANIYFVKRLIDKVESSSDGFILANASIEKLSRDVNLLGTLFREFKSEMKMEIKHELQDFRRIEVDIGILKAQMSERGLQGSRS